MSRRKEVAVLAMLKGFGRTTDEEDAIKHAVVDVMARVIEGAGAGRATVGAVMAVFVIPEGRVGDYRAVYDSALKYVDMVGAINSIAAQRKADMILEKLEASGRTADLGMSFVTRWLDDMGLMYETVEL